MKKLLKPLMIFSVILAACIILNPTRAQAASISDLTFTLNSDGASYSVKAKSAAIAGDLTIPATYSGKPVTTIGDSAFEYCSSLTSVTIPDSITTIGNSAFRFCSALTRVTIPDSVTTIVEYAFSECIRLTSVTIPDSVTTIGIGVFNGCSSLTSVTIPDSVTTIGNNAFFRCSSLTCVTIPDSVTTIGNHAFYGCSALTSATIGNSVITIGNSAFLSCRSLASVTIPDSVTTIGNNAFRSCDALTSVTIGKSVTTIGTYAFGYCSSLTGIWVDENNPNYSNDSYGVLFNKDKTTLIQAPGAIKSYAIPNSVTSIGSHAFSYCTSLISVTIPDSVTTIVKGAFRDCSALTSVSIGNSVTTIGINAFNGCTSLTSVTIPDSVTTIGNYAFYSDNKLAYVFYTGTRSQWKAISVGSDNAPLKYATLHFISCETKGHTEEIVPGKAASCTESGLTEGKKCAVCEEVLVAQEEIPAIGHSYDHDFDASCNVCGEVRELNNTYKFVNYRVVFADTDTTHKNLRVEVYNLGEKTVANPTDEKALKAIDASPATHWGASNIKKILITDAGNYVLLLKYNIGTGAATKVPLTIRVSSNPKLIIDKNNKLTAIDKDGANINHRAVVYYLGDQTVEDIYDEAALTAIDSAPETHWQKTRINRLALTKGGNYVLHLCYNVGTGAKQTVAQQFTVESIPTLSIDINNKVVVTEENTENKNHRAVVYFLGENTVDDPYDESSVMAAAISTSKTYWGLSEINKQELTEGGNYVIHLYYNVGTSEKRTLALDVTLNERPALSVGLDNKLVVTYTDPEINNLRAYIYNVGDNAVSDIYDEAALKKIATPTQVWGLSSILKKQLTPGTYVVHLYYSVGTSAKKTVALKVTI